jgi:putative methyltransferase (TIGR04325 family)
VLLISGTIQYLDEPFAFLDKVLSKNIEYIIIDRSPFTEQPAYVQVQQVRKPIYDASFPIHIMNYNEFVNKLNAKYKLWFKFPSVDKKIGEAEALGMVFIKK